MAGPEPKLRDLFIKALLCQTAEEQAAYLEQTCQGDAELRAQLDDLLQAHREAGSFLQEPSVAGTATVDTPPMAEHPGTVIGPYKLLQQIGEGGMGTVFMAEQISPVQRKVALKVIKAGMDSRQVIARFEAERQALAIMDHVNIARVFDAGATASGRPYFVMELVHGVPITKYCDDNHLTPRQRLELFVPVCLAIQHAHQKGVIHRDIKPSNVMVTLYDGKPVPKVIDFGVAKATEQKLTERTLFTQYGAMVGTLEYMSPEQAEMSALGVDTRSDIFSLGVLLYELLTGSTPLSHKRLKEAAYGEILRMIREEEAPRPSIRLSDSGEALASISANRHTEPAKLTKLMRGELDWIVMKCLEKDRNRRYETANSFAADVQRYLTDEPVAACPPSMRYRAGKFARRHWRVLTAALAFVVLLMSAVATLSVALVAVNRERQQKEAALDAEGKRRKQARTALDAMSSQVIEDWLAKQPGLLPEHKQFLENALRYYEEFAADTGQDEESRSGVAHAYWRVGFIQERLGQWKAAESAWERSRDVGARLVADFPGIPVYREHLTQTHTDLGNLYRTTSHPEAETTLRQGLTIGRNLVADFPGEPVFRWGLATTLNHLGILLKNASRAQEAEEVYGQALTIQRQLVADSPTVPANRDALAQTQTNLGLLFEIVDRPREAIEALEQAVAIHKQLAADFPTMPLYRDQLATSRSNLGFVLQGARRHAEAEDVFRQALTTRRQLVAEFPAMPVYRRGLAITLNNLGILLKNTGRSREAEELFGQTLAIHKQLAADFPTVSDHQNEAAGAMVNLARVLLARKELQGARRLLEEAVPYHQAALKASPRHPAYRSFYLLNRWRMTETLLELNEHAAAAAAAGQFLKAGGETPRDAYTAACMLAGCVRLAAQDEHLPERKRQELTAAYGDSALVALRLAIAKGAKEAVQIKQDPNLDPLRRRADFQKLLNETVK